LLRESREGDPGGVERKEPVSMLEEFEVFRSGLVTNYQLKDVNTHLWNERYLLVNLCGGPSPHALKAINIIRMYLASCPCGG